MNIGQRFITGLLSFFVKVIMGEPYKSSDKNDKVEVCSDPYDTCEEEMIVEVDDAHKVGLEDKSNERNNSCTREKRGRNRGRSERRSFARRSFHRSVSFEEKKKEDNIRDKTTGISVVNVLNVSYDRIYKTDVFLKSLKV